jgi:hypothetical protein
MVELARIPPPPVVLESGPGRPELLPVDPESKERQRTHQS